MSSKGGHGSGQRRWPVFVLTNALGTILILEIALRLFLGTSFPTRYFEPHDRFGHFHVPGRSGWQRTGEYATYTTINEQGLRDDPHTYQKPESISRTLVVGDSFVEGLQVDMDQTFSAQLETMLSEPGGTPVEVINGGVSRYGTDNTLLFLEGEGIRYQPDLVVYAFYPNDVTDNIENDLFRLVDGELVQQPVQISFLDQLRGPLYDVSFIYRTALGVSLRARQQADDTLVQTAWGLVLPVYRDPLLPREEAAWQLTAALLERMQGAATAADAQLLVVYLPEIYQSEDAAWAQVEDAAEVLSRDAPNARLAEIIPAETLFLDLAAGFRAGAQSESLYYELDHHFNAAGHRLAAELLYEYVTQNGLLVD